jgi:hypothetical protein
MNTVLIDEAQQSETTPARVVDYVDQPLATFMVGDAKYSRGTGCGPEPPRTNRAAPSAVTT